MGITAANKLSVRSWAGWPTLPLSTHYSRVPSSGFRRETYRRVPVPFFGFTFFIDASWLPSLSFFLFFPRLQMQMGSPARWPWGQARSLPVTTCDHQPDPCLRDQLVTERPIQCRNKRAALSPEPPAVRIDASARKDCCWLATLPGKKQVPYSVSQQRKANPDE